MITDRTKYDVVVMGGGLSGLTVALQILQRRPQTSVLVVERQAHPVPEAAHKVGESTVEMAGHYYGEVLGLRDHLESAELRKMGLRYYPAVQTPPPPLSRRAEIGPGDFLPLKTYQLDRGRFENELGERVTAAGAEFRHGCRVQSFDLDRSGHTVTVSRDDERSTVDARWVIDASGRRALIKRKLGLEESVGHDCNAVWLRLSEMIWMDRLIEEEEDPPPDDTVLAEWRARVPNGQRWRATNHLMGRGYWAWLIPLASGSISVGLVADPRCVPFEEVNSLDKLLGWLEANEPELARAIAKRRDSLQDFRMLKHYAHSCKQVFSADRWALTGEAGVFTDPLYSPGSDFIGISNSWTTELVTRDLDGMRIDELAPLADTLYLGSFKSLLGTWEDQYPLMGNPQVWAGKVCWDVFGYYLAFGVLFCTGRLIDGAFMESVAEHVARFTALNQRMQAFFREWDDADRGTDSPFFVDPAGPLFRELHETLLEPIDDERLRTRLSENVLFAEDLARVLMAGAARQLGDAVEPADIDPLVFRLGQRPDGDGDRGYDREEVIDRISDAVAGIWRPSRERSAAMSA
jgi:flavin-dependent dehydrogenase